MKGLKENKGFTLIELLAVIVVLAIVMVLAVTTVLPYMTQARKEAFALEANTAKDAASSAMSLIMIGSLDEDYYVSYEDGSYCFTIENLMKAGLYEKDAKDENDNYVYQGIVKVTQSEDKAYTYEVSLKNDQYYVSAISKEVVKGDVNEGAAPNGFATACPAAS